jgi:hypothetical protein
MEDVYEVSNFLLPDELKVVESLVSNKHSWEVEKNDEALGRILYRLPIPNEILKAIELRVGELVGKKLDQIGVVFTNYESQYGQPNLPPHFDGDNNSLIIDYQFRSNTHWGLGVDTTVFDMEDNKAVIFNPNQYPHWRPFKTFGDGEYVTMAFFRFPDSSGKTDYSHMRYSQNHEIFQEVRKIRDSL